MVDAWRIASLSGPLKGPAVRCPLAVRFRAQLFLSPLPSCVRAHWGQCLVPVPERNRGSGGAASWTAAWIGGG